MIDFWLAAGLLLLAALAFCIPLLRDRRAQAEEDRTALNVALYQGGSPSWPASRPPAR